MKNMVSSPEQKFPLGIRVPVWAGVGVLAIWALNSFLSWWAPLDAVLNGQLGETPSWFFVRELPLILCGAPWIGIAVIVLLALGLVWISRR